MLIIRQSNYQFNSIFCVFITIIHICCSYIITILLNPRCLFVCLTDFVSSCCCIFFDLSAFYFLDPCEFTDSYISLLGYYKEINISPQNFQSRCISDTQYVYLNENKGLKEFIGNFFGGSASLSNYLQMRILHTDAIRLQQMYVDMHNMTFNSRREASLSLYYIVFKLYYFFIKNIR